MAITDSKRSPLHRRIGRFHRAIRELQRTSKPDLTLAAWLSFCVLHGPAACDVRTTVGRTLRKTVFDKESL